MIKFDNFPFICFRNRRRLVKGKRVAGSKIEKLVDVFPQAIFSSGMVVLAVHFVCVFFFFPSKVPVRINSYQFVERVK